MDRRFPLLLLVPCFLLGLARTASAYGWDDCHGKVHWDRGWTNLHVSTTSFPENSAWDDRLQNAMWHWNNVKGSGFSFFVGRDTDGTHRLGNGVNEVYLDDDPSGSTLAVTRTRYTCYWLFGWHQGIDETDVEFDSDRSWRLAPLDYGNLDSPFSFEGVALHEFGHALGLNHEDRWLAILNAAYPGGGTLGQGKIWDPLPDDRSGARFLYPDRTSETDVAASVFRRLGTSTTDLVSSSSSATAGSQISLGFTFANLGTQRADFQIGFYLSQNAVISTADTLLGTNTAWAEAGAIGTYTRTLTIPAATPPGQYQLGFIVDHVESLAEANEVNNAVALPRPLQVLGAPPPPPRCRSDRECPRGQRCVEGRCRWRFVLAPCDDDGDCARGERCRDGICRLASFVIPPDFCALVECPDGCRCREGACGCPLPDDRCARMRCPPDSICMNGRCEPFGGFPPHGPPGPSPPPPR